MEKTRKRRVERAESVESVDLSTEKSQEQLRRPDDRLDHGAMREYLGEQSVQSYSMAAPRVHTSNHISPG